MNLLDHYQALTKVIKESGEQSFTVTEAANVFACSERNAKLLIKKMERADWIKWTSGQGRGNTSRIELLKSISMLIYEDAQNRAKAGSVDLAIQQIQACSPQDQQRFLAWMSAYFVQSDAQELDDHLRFPSYRPIPVLNPALVDRRSENHIMHHLFNCLVNFNEKKQFSGELAHHWTCDETFSTWTFYLRKSVYFHNGALFTSADVKKRFEEIHSFWGLQSLDTITCMNAYTCQFSFSRPHPMFLHILASLPCSILHEDSTNRLPIGTGPFQLVQNTNQKLTMIAFDRYFLSRPLLEDVTMYFFPHLYDNQPAYELASDNRLNFYHYPYELQSNANLNQFDQMDQGCKLLTLNTTKGPMNDTLLREAIYHLLEPEDLIRSCKGNRFVRATRLRLETETSPTLERSKETGKQLLEASKYDGQILQLYSYEGAGNEADAEWIQLQLTKAGITIDIHVIPYDSFHSNKKKEAHLLLGEQLVYDDSCYTYLNAFFHVHGIIYGQQNVFALDDTPYFSLDRVDASVSILESLENQLVNQFIMIPLYRIKQFAIFPPKMMDVVLNTFGWVDYTKLWIKPDTLKS